VSGRRSLNCRAESGKEEGQISGERIIDRMKSSSCHE
jgi:hypothetical protein